MSPEPNANIPDKKLSESKNISIEIESTPPFILAVAQLFRAHKQPKQSVELCRQGLNNFPGNMGLRLGMALGYLDLKEKEKAWSEITAVAQELNQLAPTLETVAYVSKVLGQPGLFEWFTLLSQALATYPEAGPGNKAEIQFPEKTWGKDLEIEVNSRGLAREQSPPPLMENPGEDPAEGVLSDSKVLKTLGGWVSQLKVDKTELSPK